MGLWFLLLAASVTFPSLTGTVTDAENGAPLPGVMISILDPLRVAYSDSIGRYALNSIPAGEHWLEARRVGYARRRLLALLPETGTLEIDVALSPAADTLRAIQVSAAAPVRGLEDENTPFPDRSLTLDDVRDHPLLSEPDVFQAAGGGAVVLRPESPDGVHIRGGASDQTTYLIDGIPVFSPYSSGGMFSAWNPDVLARIDVLTSVLPPDSPDALSGVVAATTRAPGARLQSRGSVSSTQARATIDGPLWWSGAGYVASWRSAFPGSVARKRERSYLRGEAGDWFAKAESPLLGGQLRLLGYGSESELAAGLAETAVDPLRNAVAWGCQSVGGSWSRALRRASVSVRAWSAFCDATARWKAEDSLVVQNLTARRRDEGMVAQVEVGGRRRNAVAGIRAQRMRTYYGLPRSAGTEQQVALGATTPIAAAFVSARRSNAAGSVLEASLVSDYACGQVYLGPSAQVRWNLVPLSLTVGYSRRHQFAQSLRNTESVVGNIFPADLYVGAGSSGMPVARSDIGIVALEHRHSQRLRLGAQAYARNFDGLAVVGSRGADPFATNGFQAASGRAYGLSLEAAAKGARYAFLASYGLQRVRLQSPTSSYAPDYAATHLLDVGLTAFPSRSLSLRLGASSAYGRRTTAFTGALEWESCNLLDRGCEFVGGPEGLSGALGSTRLPAYLRVDLGVRKDWRMRLAGRQGSLSVFGTVTNLLGRTNVLTVAVDPSSGQRQNIEMRPRSPLVVGVDWGF